MRVQLCFKTPEMEEGKIKVVTEEMTVKKAELFYKGNLKGKVDLAYLRHFDGWRYVFVKYLYKKEE